MAMVNHMDVQEIADAVPDGALLGVPADYSGVPMAVTRALIPRGTRNQLPDNNNRRRPNETNGSGTRGQQYPAVGAEQKVEMAVSSSQTGNEVIVEKSVEEESPEMNP